MKETETTKAGRITEALIVRTYPLTAGVPVAVLAGRPELVEAEDPEEKQDE